MLVRAHTADYAQQESLPLPLDFDELLSTVSEAFALQRGSVRIRSKHAPTDLWVVLASQSQLMDAVREVLRNEFGLTPGDAIVLTNGFDWPKGGTNSIRVLVEDFNEARGKDRERRASGKHHRPSLSEA